MKGEKEQKCFEVAKNDFMKEYPTRFFGLNCEEIKNIKVLFDTAKINENTSEFPDIILNDGFIEHFQITSSKENKKGAVHIKELTDFKSRIRKEMTEIQANRDFSEKHWIMPYSEHSYENLVRSFKKNWNNHIESFEKYKGKRIAVISHGGTIKFYLLSFCKVNERLNLEYKENELAINSPCLLKMTFRKNELVNLEQMKL